MGNMIINNPYYCLLGIFPTGSTGASSGATSARVQYRNFVSGSGLRKLVRNIPVVVPPDGPVVPAPKKAEHPHGRNYREIDR